MMFALALCLSLAIPFPLLFWWARRLAIDLRTRDYVLIHGRSYRRPVLGVEWILEQLPPIADPPPPRAEPPSRPGAARFA